MKITWYKQFAKPYKEFLKFEQKTNSRFDADYSFSNFVDYLDRFYQED